MDKSRVRLTWRAAVAASAFALAGGVASAGSAFGSSGDPGGLWSTTSSQHTADAHAAPAVVTGWSDVEVRDAPTVHAPATSTLAPGTHIELFCQTIGGWVHGTSTWYFDNNAHGWVSAAHVQPTAWHPPYC